MKWLFHSWIPGWFFMQRQQLKQTLTIPYCIKIHIFPHCLLQLCYLGLKALYFIWGQSVMRWELIKQIVPWLRSLPATSFSGEYSWVSGLLMECISSVTTLPSLTSSHCPSSCLCLMVKERSSRVQSSESLQFCFRIHILNWLFKKIILWGHHHPNTKTWQWCHKKRTL